MASNENYVIRVRRGTTNEWAVYNPILGEGELGFDTTNDRLKVGDGLNVWSNLKFATGNSFDVARDAGFVGSLAEWLDTLKGGPKGPMGPIGPTGELSRKIYRKSDTEIERTITNEAEVLKIIDENSTNNRDTMRFEDIPEHSGSIINVHHRGDGRTTPQSYGINIANHFGASSAFIIHQYSKKSPAIQIDNTDISTSFFIKNTENKVQNPDGTGTGAFMQFMPYGQDRSLFFNDNLQWINFTKKDMLVRAIDPSIYAFGVQVDTDKTGIQVMKNGTGAGSALAVTNKGTGPGISVVQNASGTAMTLISTHVDSFGTKISSLKYGATVETSENDGFVFDLTKRGTGSGIVQRIVNKGTGDSLVIVNGTETKFQIKANGELELWESGIGIVLRSSNGTRYRLYVNDSGEVKTLAG